MAQMAKWPQKIFKRQRAKMSPRDVDHSLTKWDDAAMAGKAEEEVYNFIVKTFDSRVAPQHSLCDPKCWW